MTGGVLRTAAVLVALSGPFLAADQQPGQEAASSPAGLILGRALDGDGRALSDAEITLTRSAGNVQVDPLAAPAPSPFPMRSQTGNGGYFLFHDLPKGSYLLSGLKAGYLQTAAGRKTPTDTGSQAIVLNDGDKKSDVVLVFWKPATLSGTVVDEAGEPLIGEEVHAFRRAVTAGRVTLLPNGNTATSDDRGVYRFSSLTPGTYVVGIVISQATVPTALQATIAEAQRSGSVPDVMRELRRSQTAIGGVGGFGAGERIGSWLLTDDSMMGRTSARPPVQGGRVFVYPTTFYPASATVSRATVLTLGSGEDRSGIDFQLRPVPTAAVSGTVEGLAGPEALMTLSLEPAGIGDAERNLRMVTATTVTDQTGQFAFLGVPAGAYTIRAIKMPAQPDNPNTGVTTLIQTPGGGMISSSLGPGTSPPIPDGPTEWNATPVTVGETDVPNVSVALSAGSRLAGRVELDSAATAAKPTSDQLRALNVQILPADGAQANFPFQISRANVDAAGQIKTYQLPPGRYVIRALAPPGWVFKTATVDGRNVADAPLEVRGEEISNLVVTLTDKLAELTGSARDRNGRDLATAVIVFPVDPTQWADYGPNPRRLKTARVGTNGAYSLTGLPAGDYLVAALRDDPTQDWTDVKFLEKAAAVAIRVTLADREIKSQDLTTVEVR